MSILPTKLALHEPERHVVLEVPPWNPDAAKSAIQEIVDDAAGRFDADQFWPSHPMEDDRTHCTPLYRGAAGVIWAIDYLRRQGAAKCDVEFVPVLPGLLAANRAEFATFGEFFSSEQASLLMGDVGVLLLTMRLAPNDEIADELHRRVTANLHLPVMELMWGTPGTMLAAIFMYEMTGQDCWRQIYQQQAERLLGDLEETELGPLWTQDLYGHISRYLGPVHGYAGSMLALLHGWEWLGTAQRAQIPNAVLRTLTANAWRSEMGTTWDATATRETLPKLVQYCHGAPGMVSVFADPKIATAELTAMLVDAGHFTWRAGPLAKGCNLCHGTAGNAYAFLKLYALLREPLWLERARTFAMISIEQYREARAQYGQGRYSLWTGDLGLAVYLYDCLRAIPAFPTTDVF